MSQKWTVFCAEYLVIFEGLILLLLSLEESGPINQISMFVSGTILLIISVSVTKVLKRIFHKRRPAKKLELFVPFDRYAFPSGHATGLASVTTFILSYNLLFGLVALLASVVIVLARINSHVHDSYDMIVGACVGTVITYYLMNDVSQYVLAHLVPAFFS